MTQKVLHQLGYVRNATSHAVMGMAKDCLIQNDAACMKISVLYHINFYICKTKVFYY